jgi:hypothetical protein
VSGKLSAAITGLIVGATAWPAAAQVVAQGRDQAQLVRPQTARPRIDPVRESRYQIGVMERVLEDAVEHGFNNWRERLQGVVPAQTMLLDNARVRGYRLDDYGVFFDVDVPSLEMTWFSVMRTLDQNGLGLDSALKTVKAHVDASGDTNLEQALKRIELQVGSPAGFIANSLAPGAPGQQAGAPALQIATAASDPRTDPILTDPEDTYRAEVIHALSDAMLDHGGPLEVGPTEWLTIGARRNEVRPRIAPADSNARTIVIRLRGSDLKAFRAAQISREQAIERIEVRVF